MPKYFLKFKTIYNEQYTRIIIKIHFVSGAKVIPLWDYMGDIFAFKNQTF